MIEKIEDYRSILDSITSIVDNNETDELKIVILKYILAVYNELDTYDAIGEDFSYAWNKNVKRIYERDHSS